MSKDKDKKSNKTTRREVLIKIAYAAPIITSLLLSRETAAQSTCHGQCPRQCVPLCTPICTPVCTPHKP
jgi:hypothetical protein